ncbi:MAG: CRISPR-associated endonuclease Cas1 [Verrucomicrobiia bacterium]
MSDTHAGPKKAAGDLPSPQDRSRSRTSRTESDKPAEPSLSPIGQQALEALRRDPQDETTTPETIPARMLNEFVYCPRLFYYEHVDAVFQHNADTLKGKAAHRRVDSGTGALPPPETIQPIPGIAQESNEEIHSRSVQLASDRLGVTAKLDLVEGHQNGDDLFSRVEVSPVEYKVGAPRLHHDTVTLWDADKMQLGLQCLLLRDNGYPCSGGWLFYRATRQRIRLDLTPELEQWILSQIAQARATMRGSIPPPLVDSPKCVRCSLAPICLPDETHLLQQPEPPASGTATTSTTPPPRRLIAPATDQKALYLNTPGLHIGRSANVLQVRDKKQLLEEIRLADLHHVALFGNIQISTQLVQKLCELEIPLTYFSTGGWFYGITRGHSLKNILTRIAQFKIAADPAASLRVARSFVSGKIRNQRTLLMRNHMDPPAPALNRLRQAARDALQAESLPSLLGIEGAAAAEYFSNFSGMLKPGDDDSPTAHPRPPFPFDFTTRNRRPPRDPVNALLSLLYSMLARDCSIAALAVGFDPWLGFFHQPRFGRPALALDLMEEFRPLIADSTVLTLINNQMLTPGHFIAAGDFVNLTPEGRKIVFESYERRMQHLITHPVFDYKVSYRRAIELQARILARWLEGEIPQYRPFLTR